MNTYHVYVLANRYRTVLYIGVTGHLPRRLAQHARGQGSRLTAHYRVTDLVHAEAYTSVWDALQVREAAQALEPREEAGTDPLREPDAGDPGAVIPVCGAEPGHAAS